MKLHNRDLTDWKWRVDYSFPNQAKERRILVAGATQQHVLHTFIDGSITVDAARVYSLIASAPALRDALEQIVGLSRDGQEINIHQAIELLGDVQNIARDALSKTEPSDERKAA